MSWDQRVAQAKAILEQEMLRQRVHIAMGLVRDEGFLDVAEWMAACVDLHLSGDTVAR